MDRILVIKLGALGDFILSYRAMTAIRAHHADARITLLTIPAMEPLAVGCGLFDEVWYDDRPKALELGGWIALMRRLKSGRFQRVYDLQTADRTATYFRIMGPPFAWPRPQWSGIVRGCSHRHEAPDRTSKHTLERQVDQLAITAIYLAEYPTLDLSWVDADIARHGVRVGADPYVLLVPGGSAGHPEKRWPAQRYADLASVLAEKGFTPVVLGTRDEARACAIVAAASPRVANLCDDSPLLDVMALARGAVAAVGNDTGPMHLIAAMGCPCLSLYSAASDPEKTRPRGPYEGPGAVTPAPGVVAKTVTVLREDDLADLSLDRVLAALNLG
jgi:ADP-heptose:LPS heptosyltransferase